MWVVDPIDGTANFARGVPHFCVSIACVADGRVEVGVIYNPMLDELFAARRGGGARLNGAPISASRAASLANASVEVGWNSRAGFGQYVDLLSRVASTGASPSRTGSGALAIAYVAAGRSDGFVEHHINAWDCLAGILLVSEAGGYVSDFLKGDGLTKGQSAYRQRARGQGRPDRRGGLRGRRRMTEITLTHGDARATIALLGAEARQWRVAGRDLLWPGDPAIWSDISPILYPVVGWTRNGEERVDGRTLPARPARLRPVRDLRASSPQRPDFARLTLSDNARTRAVYPFAFALAVEYRLSADALAIAIEVANPGAVPAPYACGLHPGFRWPLGGAGREGALVRFDQLERPEVPRDRARRAHRQDDASDSAPGPRPPAHRRAVRPRRALLPRLREPVARLRRRLRRVDHYGVSRAFLTPRYGRGPARRSFASRPGPATAIRTGSRANSSTSPACARSSRATRARHEARFVFRPE